MRSILATSLLLLMGTACSKELPAPIGGTDAATPRRGGVLTLATFGDIRGIDPASISDGLAPSIVEALFAGLVDYDDDGKIQPDIAERWTVEDEGKTYRFFLRTGVRFHDGDEVTAADVKRSIERSLHPATPNAYASYFTMIAGYDDFAEKKTESLAGVTVDGTHVVTFHLKEADATFLPLVALLQLRPVCKSGGDRYSADWTPCGAGPFKLGEWQRGLSLTLVRHEGYFHAGLPYLDGVRWTFHETQTSQTLKFARGDLDITREMTSTELLKLQTDPRWKPFGEYDVDKQILGEAMNVEMPPFDNVEVRRAVASAIDRDEMRKLRAGSLRATGQLVPYAIFGHDDALHEQTYDYAAALEHMRRAGYAYDPVAQTGGWPGIVPYLVYKAGLQEYTGQLLAQQLARIGIRIELRIVNYPTFMALRGRRKASPFGPGLWMEDFPDALSFLEPLFHTKALADEGTNNWSFYSNPRFDDLVDRSHHELDDARRKELYSAAQAILVDDAPWAFTENVHLYTQRQGYVRGHRTNPMWTHDTTRAWIDRADRSGLSRAMFSPPSRHAVEALLGR